MALVSAPNAESITVDDVPRLCDRTELLGPYEGSGFTTPQFLVRRGDGQVIRVSQLLYLITAQMDGRNNLEQIARLVSTQMDRQITARDIAHLVDTKLDQLGIVHGRSAPAPNAATDPLLGLRFRAGLVPERLHRGITNLLRPAFSPAVVTIVLLALTALDTWLIANRRSALLDGWFQILTRPGLFLALTIVTFVAMAFHEFGHATACRYSGGRPGAMGVGVYIVWPAFFTDVSDAYRLDRRGRLRTDLGGIYFNAIFALAAGTAYLATGFAPLLVICAMTQGQALYQLVPFLRLDGYYILGDVIGVPNPFAYVRATIVTLFSPRGSSSRLAAHASLHAVKRSARIALRVWILVAIPVLLAGLALSVYLLPRTVPVLYSTLRLDAQIVKRGVADGDWIDVANGAVQFLFMTLPILGWLSTLWFVVKALAKRPWARNLFTRRTWTRPVTVAIGAAVVVGAVAATLSLRSSTEGPEFTAPLAAAAHELHTVDAHTADLHAADPHTAMPVESPVATAAPAPTPVAPLATFSRWALSVPIAEVTARADGVAHHDISIGVWLVEPGDDFWHMSEQILTDAYGRSPTPAEIGAYWLPLVEANRDRLVNTAEPGTIYAGQEFTVILPAQAQDDPSGAAAPGGLLFGR